MATAHFYTHNKRHNSTLQPTGQGDQVTVNLKGGSDLLTPVFLLNMSGTPSFNYMLFQGRYYFITGYKSVRENLWEVSAEVDVLGTYKGTIGNTYAYVLYHTHTNTEIADRRLSVGASKSVSSASGSFGFLGKASAYILTVIGKHKTTAYALNKAQIDDMYSTDYQDAFDNTVYDIPDVTGTGFADTLIDLVRWFKDFITSTAGAFNYAGTISENIKSCLILPISIGSIGGSAPTDLLIGAIDTGVDAKMITDRFFTDTATVNIPWQATDWRRLEPYHEVFLYIPALGLISLSPSDLIGQSSLTVKVSMDVLSGDAIFEVKAGGNTVHYANTNLSTQYALGSSQTSGANVANSLVAAAGAVTGNPAAMLGGALGLANSLKPNPMCIGSNSGGAILGINADTIACYTIFHDTTVTPNSISTVKGTPFNGVAQISTLSGYVQTDGASVAGPMTDTERQQINQLLDGGIYFE